MQWNQTRVLVTGGASFIDSAPVDALVGHGAKVLVVDNLSSGKRENMEHHVRSGAAEFMEGDLLDPGVRGCNG